MIFQTFNRQNKKSAAFNHNFLLHWMPNLCEKVCTECRQEKVNVIEMTNVGSQTDYQSMDARGRNLMKCYDKALIYTQYIKKRNMYIFADNLNNFKDVHFKTCRIHRLVCLTLVGQIP